MVELDERLVYTQSVNLAISVDRGFQSGVTVSSKALVG